MLSKNELIQYVSDNPNKYYNSTEELLKNFQQAYSYTAFAYFAPEKKIFGVKKLISWPDTSEELSNAPWEASQRPWYINAINSKGKVAWTKPYIDSTTKKYILTVSKNVMNKENKFAGVMAIDIYLDDLSEKINYLKKFNKGDIFIISRTDNKNFFIVDNTKTNELKYIFNDNLINKMYNKKSGSFYSDNNTGNYYVSYTTNRATGWKVIGVIEKQQLIKETNVLVNNIFIGIAAVVFISIISILYITKQMGSTIQTLSVSIKSTEEKTLPQSAKVTPFRIENEDFLFEKPASDINILFEIEYEKQNLDNLIKNINNFNLSKAEDVKNSLKTLTSYKSKLNPSIKSHEAEMLSLNNFLIKIREKLTSLAENFNHVELKSEIVHLCKLIDTITNS